MNARIRETCVILILAVSGVLCCINDFDCEASSFCARNGSCILIPKNLGDECRSDGQCIAVDVWSRCINGTCKCEPPYVDRHGTCFCDGTLPGATVSIFILLYTLLPISILLAIVIAILCTLRGRSVCRSSPPETPIDVSVSVTGDRLSVSYKRRSSRSVSSIDTRPQRH